jgi:hypothetical protein
MGCETRRKPIVPKIEIRESQNATDLGIAIESQIPKEHLAPAAAFA